MRHAAHNQHAKPSRWPWRAIIFGCLLVIGLALLATPAVYTHWARRQARTVVTEYSHRAKASRTRTAAWRRYNHALAAGKRARLPLTAPQRRQTLGYVSVPAIHLAFQPLYYGGDNATLAKGVGVMPGTSLPLGGRSTLSVLAGHSGFGNQIIFDNIRRLKKGDVFYVTALGQPRHAYRVYKKLVVDPRAKNALAPIRIQRGRDITVLLTCTPIILNTNRLLVFGRRVPLAQAKTTGTRHLASSPLALLIGGGGLLIVLVGGLIGWWRLTQRRHAARRARR